MVGAGVGGAGPLVAEPTDVMSLVETVDTLLYVAEADKITLLILLTNELVSVTPMLAIV